MKKLLLLLIGSFGCVSFAHAEPPLVHQMLPYIWKVQARQYQGGANGGTGVMIAPEKIITNCHVTAGAYSIAVTNAATGAQVAVTREAYDVDEDLCLLVAPGSGDVVVQLDTDDAPAVGTPAFTVGFPLMQLSYSEGKVTSTYEFHGVPVIGTSVGCNHGNSGGPLFNEQGELMGVTAFGHKNRDDCNAITGSHIQMMLARTPIEVQAGLGNDWFETRSSPR